MLTATSPGRQCAFLRPKRGAKRPVSTTRKSEESEVGRRKTEVGPTGKRASDASATVADAPGGHVGVDGLSNRWPKTSSRRPDRGCNARRDRGASTVVEGNDTWLQARTQNTTDSCSSAQSSPNPPRLTTRTGL